MRKKSSTPSPSFDELRQGAEKLLPGKARNLCIVLGDQLDRRSALWDGFESDQDVVLMMEVAEESLHVASHVQRTAIFLAAMRHYAVELWQAGRPLDYRTLDDADNTGTFLGEVQSALERWKPDRVRVVLPGEWRVLNALQNATKSRVPLEVLPDRHFTVSPDEYSAWLGKKSSTRMEFFYRWQRKRLGVLMDGGEPVLGRWNFDAENREAVTDPDHRAAIPERCQFAPDAITQEVLDTARRHFPNNPGSLESFAWPVTPEQATAALNSFIAGRLQLFGRYQDALLAGEQWLWHSHISAALNLKLLDPRDCVDAAEQAYAKRLAPIESVEGFIRQIIGWREFIRCVYYQQGKDYAARNELQMHGKLPSFYWSGDTPMRCVRETVCGTLQHGYAHHIQRLMITGNLALLLGIHPREISDWYLAVYVDAIDWVTLPNTLGMVMHADGGVVGSKPYAASGRYIQRQSDYCKGCRFDPGTRLGAKACPFTTLYWDFMIRYRDRFARNPRMATLLKNLDRFGTEECARIQAAADQLRMQWGVISE